MTYVVGLTGGIGSGKTTVANFFSTLNVPIIDADEIARLIVAPGSSLLSLIVEHFGPSIQQTDGALDRAALRKIIFSEPTQKNWLEALLHPQIDNIIFNNISKVNYPYCIVVIPLLTEHYPRYKEYLSHVIVMNAYIEQQQQRAIDRDQDPLMIDLIIRSQASQKERLKIADTILENDGSLAQLKSKVNNLHFRFLELSTKK